jgi:GT2 family glycosyltransferase
VPPETIRTEVVVQGRAVPQHPKVSVCILVTGETQLLLQCLDSLRQPGARVDAMEIVVVANGTPKDQLEPLRCDDIVLVVNEFNLGFASGCNQATSVARAPLVLFLNDDSLVQEGCIDALVRACESDPSVGAVGARILSDDGSLQEAGSVIWRDGSASHVGEGMAGGSRAFMEPRWVDYSSANGLLVVRSAWDEAGGFDEGYFPAYFEDVDFSLALAAHGYRTKYEPRATLVHRGSRSTSRFFREFLLSRNRLRLLEKWGATLDRFDQPPAKDSGPEFEAAIDSAVRRASDSQEVPDGPRPEPRLDGPQHDPFDPQEAAAELRAAYVAYLEERVTEADRRIRTLEEYVGKLWGVRLRRWVAGRFLPPQNGPHGTEPAAPAGSKDAAADVRSRRNPT